MPLKIDIDSVREEIQEHLLDYLAEQNIEVKQNGGKYFRCIHPEHNDSDPSCHIVPDTNNREFKCFGCSAKGDIFTAAHYLEGKPIGSDNDFYTETVLYLANKYGIDVPETGELTEEEKYIFAARRAFQFVVRYMLEQEPSKEFMDELERRDWTLDRVRRLGVGQINDYKKYEQQLLQQGFDKSQLDDLGLIGPRAQWMFNAERMVFAQYDHKNRPIGLIARDLQYEAKREAYNNLNEEEKKNTKQPTKYRNTPTTKLYEKGKYLYGIDGAAQHPDKKVFIFEGQADVISYRTKTGQSNCVALSGSAFTDNHIVLLKDVGISNICLALDGDTTGQKKTKEIVEKTGGNPGLMVSVLRFPSGSDENDFDSFIRKHGINSWYEARNNEMTAFKYLLRHRDPDEDIKSFINKQAANIVNEQDPLIRWEMIKTLSDATDIPVDVIKELVNYNIDREKQEYNAKLSSLTKRTAEKLQKDPNEALNTISLFEKEIQNLDKEYNKELTTPEAQFDFLKRLRDRELENTAENGLKVGFPIFDKKTNGIPSENMIFFLGGKSNVGKTSLIAQMALNILENNNDSIVMCYTIDDSYAKFVPRMAACVADLPSYWISKPNAMFDSNGKIPSDILPPNYNSHNEILAARDNAYNKIQEFVKSGRLRIFDKQMLGGTWAKADKEVQKARNDYPESKIILFLDNFHDLEDYAGTDERIRFSELAKLLRNTATRDRMAIFSTIEYKKLPNRTKPSNDSLAESRKMEYVADGVIHLVNSQHEFQTTPNQCKVFWTDNNKFETYYDNDGVAQTIYERKPVIEMIFGKSKINSFKGHIFYKFDPEKCKFVEGSVREQREWEQLDEEQNWRMERS